MSSVDFLVKLRDAAAMIEEACKEQLEKMAPPEVKYSEEDLAKLFWETKQGAKGPFEQTSKKANNNSPVFQALQAILKDHRGFAPVGDFNYWFDQNNEEIIDRRKK